jgi:hypothetical protein
MPCCATLPAFKAPTMPLTMPPVPTRTPATTFLRGAFLGDLTRRDSLGREIVTADNVLERFMRGNNAAIMARYDDIEEAGRFALQNFVPEAAISRMDTNEVITEAMRASMMKIMDRRPVLNPATGQPMIDPATNAPRVYLCCQPE